MAPYEALKAAAIRPSLRHAQHVQQSKGRKTDKNDSLWLARICQFGRARNRPRKLEKYGFLAEEQQRARAPRTGIPAGSTSGPQGHRPGLPGPSAAGVRVLNRSAARWSQLAATPLLHPDSEKHSRSRAREQLGDREHFTAKDRNAGMTTPTPTPVAGIDVGKSSLDVHILHGDLDRQFNNDKCGHCAVRNWLLKHGVTRAVLEPTGRYHRNLRLLSDLLACRRKLARNRSGGQWRMLRS